MLKFITGNKNKFAEVSSVLLPLQIKQLNIDLTEIQGTDAKKILTHKIQEAFKHYKGEFIIDDSSLYLSCFDYKLPGPLVKWFNDTIGSVGYYNLCKKMGDFKARAITYIVYANSPKDIAIFEGGMEGKIVKPKGKYNFGYDPIFTPDGYNKTLSQLKAEGSYDKSPRGLAVVKLKRFLMKG